MLAAYNAKLLPDVERPVEAIPYGWQVPYTTEHDLSNPRLRTLFTVLSICRSISLRVRVRVRVHALSRASNIHP